MMNVNRRIGLKSLFIAVLTLCGLVIWSLYFSQRSTKELWSKDIINTFEYVLTHEEEDVSELLSPLGEGHSDTLNNSIHRLTRILEKKFAAAVVEKIKNLRPTCENTFKLANSCGKTCLQKELPENITARVEQLVAPRQLQMSTEEHRILREMGDKVNGSYKIILLTAASSNHYLETQAMLKNLHENVFPYLSNFTLVFYNLGLTNQERALMVKYCKCQVMDFPFDKFPKSMSHLGCYSWKPILIKSLIHKGNVVFWMDSSIRFHNSPKDFYQLIMATRERGVQIGGDNADTTFRTYQSMYHFFGDEACAYLKYGQGYATYGLFHREYFVDRAILEPWVACAINKDCMCPNLDTRNDCTESNRVAENYYNKGGPLVYGTCHRFDQSAISLILHKLYQDIYPWIIVDTSSVLTISRGDIANYFHALR